MQIVDFQSDALYFGPHVYITISGCLAWSKVEYHHRQASFGFAKLESGFAALSILSIDEATNRAAQLLT
jgi:hypothetical protein